MPTKAFSIRFNFNKTNIKIMIKYLIPMCCVFALIAACDLERDIDINLPEYESEIVVESYVESGQPLRALVTESLSYTELPSPTPLDENVPVTVSADGQVFTLPLSQIEALLVTPGDTLAEAQFEAFKSAIELLGLISDATVTITHNGTTRTLEEGIYFDFDNAKVYNYGNSFMPSTTYNEDFSIEVNSRERTATAITQLLPPVSFDSIVYSFDSSDTLAAVQTWFTDDPAMDNYYRFMLHKGQLGETDQDFSVNDRFFNGDPVPFGSNFEFGIGDTAIVTLFHIDEIYHDFLETYEDAFFANGNPFAQPVQITTNMEGGLGIFAGLSYVRDTVIIE